MTERTLRLAGGTALLAAGLLFGLTGQTLAGAAASLAAALTFWSADK